MALTVVVSAVPFAFGFVKIHGQEEKGVTEDEMVGWHQQLDGHEFEWTPGESEAKEAWFATVHEFAESHDWATEQQKFKDPSIYGPFTYCNTLTIIKISKFKLLSELKND